MSRDNSARMSTPELEAIRPKSTGDSFNFSLPTTFVDLPSKGKLYPEGHPLHNTESIEIKFMSAKEEDILSNINLLQKGVAVDRMIESLLIDKSISVEHLLVGDKNAIMVAARITGFGDQYTTRVSCPSCESGSDYTFNLNNIEHSSYEEIESSDVVKTDQNTFIFDLPVSKVRVEVRLLDNKDEQYLSRLAKSKRDNNLPETRLTDRLKIIIASINGSTMRGDIEKFVDNMPLLDSRYFRSLYDEIVPNIDFKQSFTCPSCGHTAVLEVPLSSQFFWPRL